MKEKVDKMSKGGVSNQVKTPEPSSGMDSTVLIKRKENAAVLAAQYTTTKRAVEIVFVSLFVIFSALTLRNIWHQMQLDNFWVVACALLLSMTLADVFSGLVHWGADTWGTLNTPLVGKSFIRSFREHHVDPMRMTYHDIVETNGDNCMIIVPALILLSFVSIRKDNLADLFTVSFLVSLAAWISLTNQIHKWAHQIRPPAAISFLQDIKFVLSRKNHQTHHHNPFDRYYCITNGWLNPVLASIAFWKRMEIVIQWASAGSIVPRQDDAYWTIQRANSEASVLEKQSNVSH